MKLDSAAAFRACQSYSSGSAFDPPDDGPYCPECESENVKTTKYTFECMDCGYYDEADFEALLGLE